MGRPKVEIDKENFEKLCNLQCTLTEIAGFFKCSEDTIQNWCKKTYDNIFSVVYKKYSQNGKISLRRYQFDLAKKNATMAIWLGKQYLGQTDIVTVQSADEIIKNMNSIYDKLKNPVNNRNIEELEK